MNLISISCHLASLLVNLVSDDIITLNTILFMMLPAIYSLKHGFSHFSDMYLSWNFQKKVILRGCTLMSKWLHGIGYDPEQIQNIYAYSTSLLDNPVKSVIPNTKSILQKCIRNSTTIISDTMCYRRGRS